jgi:hypothetical protein
MNLYGQDRADIRNVFFDAWAKYNAGEVLLGAESTVVHVALQHPEYHDVLANREKYSDRDYHIDAGETNPFLHMGMHVTIIEQISLDKPAGVRARFSQLLQKLRDEHEVQHKMMECLGQWLWQAQQSNSPPSEQDYLDYLQRVG